MKKVHSNNVDENDVFGGGEFQFYGIDVINALRVLSGNVFSDPIFHVREIISNAMDAMVNMVSGESRIDIVFSDEFLTVRDYGMGMTSEAMRDILPSFFKTTKKSEDPSIIGSYGIGLYASLQFAREVIIHSKSQLGPCSNKAIMNKKGVYFEPSIWPGPGTEIEVHYGGTDDLWKVSERELIVFIENTFPFAPVDIYVNEKLIAGPSVSVPPWQNCEEDQVWIPGWAKDNGSDDIFCYSIRISNDVANFYLLLAKQQIPRINMGLKLFAKRVLIDGSYIPKYGEDVVSFVSGVINANNLQLTVSRDSVVHNSKSADIIDLSFHEIIGHGLARLAREDAFLFREFMDEHRNQILLTCSQVEIFKEAIYDHLVFRVASGGWRALSEANRFGKAYYAERIQQLERVSSRLRGDCPIYFFETATERKFLMSLLYGSTHGVVWHRVDEDNEDDDCMEFGVLSCQVRNAIQELSENYSGKQKAYFAYGASRSIVDVKIVKDENSQLPAWLVPRIREGLSPKEIWESARKELLAKGELVENSSIFDTYLKRQAHEDGYDRVLYLNYGHQMVVAFMELLSSRTAFDKQLSTAMLRTLISMARIEASSDWFIWEKDLNEYKKCLERLATLALSTL